MHNAMIIKPASKKNIFVNIYCISLPNTRNLKLKNCQKTSCIE